MGVEAGGESITSNSSISGAGHRHPDANDSMPELNDKHSVSSPRSPRRSPRKADAPSDKGFFNNSGGLHVDPSSSNGPGAAKSGEQGSSSVPLSDHAGVEAGHIEEEEHGLSATGGEMLYRGRLFAPSRRKTWDKVLEPFESFLGKGSGVRMAFEGKKRHDAAEKDLGVTRDCTKRMRELSNRSITARLRAVEGKVEHALSVMEIREAAVRDAAADQERRQRSELLALCAQYAATIEHECQLLNEQATAETLANERTIREMEERLAVEEFSLHLEHETNGSVLLRRLLESNPQYVRCRRATSENVKGDFFSAKSDYSGINVLEVFKVENKPMLRAFQQRAASLKSGSVKGLFCSVDRESLESLVVQGLHKRKGEHAGTENFREGVDSDDEHESSDTNFDSASGRASQVYGRKLFTHSQFTPQLANADISKNSKDGTGLAEQAYLESKSVPFPAIFSRYSTLESDRHLVQETGAHGSKRDPNIPVVRHVALCRVIIGNAFFTSNDYRGFPSVDAMGSKYDSMYSSSQEEYLMLNADYVLPEFIIRFEYINRYQGCSKGKARSNTGEQNGSDSAQSNQNMDNDADAAYHAIPTDFSSPNVPQIPCGPIMTPPLSRSVVPRAVGLPSNGSDRNTLPESRNQRNLSKLVHAAEVQAGREALAMNAAKQREQIWSDIANLLINNRRAVTR